MTTLEALRNVHLKWRLFVKAVREEMGFVKIRIRDIYAGLKFYELCLGFLLLAMGTFLLALAYTIIFGGGIEYSVKIGR